MPKKHRNELVAGIFVALALAALVGVVLWLGGSTMISRPAGNAVFYVNEKTGATGLVPGNPVLINDSQIGRISWIQTTPEGRTLYHVDLFEKIVLHSDGTALAVQPMVGTPKLVITSRGSEDKPVSSASNPIPLTASGLDAAMGNVATAADNLRVITESVRNELDSTRRTAMLTQLKTITDSLAHAADNVSTMTGNLLHESDPKAKDSLVAKARASADDVNKITATVATQLDGANPQALLTKVHKSVDDMNAITADAKPKIQQTLSAVQDTATQIQNYTRKDVAEVLANLRQVNSKVMTIASNFVEVSDQARVIVTLSRDRLDEMLDNMTQVSQDLKSTAKEVRRNPWRLLYQPDQKELRTQNIHDAARAFAAGAEQLYQAVNKLSALSKSPNIKSDDPELIKIRQQLQETFDNFHKAEDSLWKELAK